MEINVYKQTEINIYKETDGNKYLPTARQINTDSQTKNTDRKLSTDGQTEIIIKDRQTEICRQQ